MTFRHIAILVLVAAAVVMAQLPKPGSGGGALVAGTDYAAPNNSGTFASLPTCTTAINGSTYSFTDSPIYTHALCRSGAWSYFASSTVAYPFDNTAFSDYNSPTVATFGGGATIKDATTTGSTTIRGRVKSVPSAPYTITAAYRITSIPFNNNFYGFGVTDGTKVKVISNVSSAGSSYFQVNYYTNSTTYNATRATAQFSGVGMGPVIWVSLEDDNANWKWRVGTNPSSMVLLLTETRNTDLTASSVGFFVNNERASLYAELAAFSWRQQ